MTKSNTNKSCTQLNFLIHVALNRTGHMSFLTGQVLPDRTESGLIFLTFYLINMGNHFSYDNPYHDLFISANYWRLNLLSHSGASNSILKRWTKVKPTCVYLP